MGVGEAGVGGGPARRPPRPGTGRRSSRTATRAAPPGRGIRRRRANRRGPPARPPSVPCRRGSTGPGSSAAGLRRGGVHRRPSPPRPRGARPASSPARPARTGRTAGPTPPNGRHHRRRVRGVARRPPAAARRCRSTVCSSESAPGGTHPRRVGRWVGLSQPPSSVRPFNTAHAPASSTSRSDRIAASRAAGGRRGLREGRVQNADEGCPGMIPGVHVGRVRVGDQPYQGRRGPREQRGFPGQRLQRPQQAGVFVPAERSRRRGRREQTRRRRGGGREVSLNGFQKRLRGGLRQQRDGPPDRRPPPRVARRQGVADHPGRGRRDPAGERQPGFTQGRLIRDEQDERIGGLLAEQVQVASSRSVCGDRVGGVARGRRVRLRERRPGVRQERLKMFGGDVPGQVLPREPLGEHPRFLLRRPHVGVRPDGQQERVVDRPRVVPVRRSGQP